MNKSTQEIGHFISKMKSLPSSDMTIPSAKKPIILGKPVLKMKI